MQTDDERAEESRVYRAAISGKKRRGWNVDQDGRPMTSCYPGRINATDTQTWRSFTVGGDPCTEAEPCDMCRAWGKAQRSSIGDPPTYWLDEDQRLQDERDEKAMGPDLGGRPGKMGGRRYPSEHPLGPQEKPKL